MMSFTNLYLIRYESIFSVGLRHTPETKGILTLLVVRTHAKKPPIRGMGGSASRQGGSAARGGYDISSDAADWLSLASTPFASTPPAIAVGSNSSSSTSTTPAVASAARCLASSAGALKSFAVAIV